MKYGYDWRELLHEFLLQGKEPLVNNLISGLGHPLIHLGYAYELSSRTVAIEALGLAACFRNEWHVYLDDPQYTNPSSNPSDSLFTILDRITHDKTFDGLFDHSGSDNIETLLSNKEATAAALEYWNSWDLKHAKDQFAESQKLAVARRFQGFGSASIGDLRSSGIPNRLTAPQALGNRKPSCAKAGVTSSAPSATRLPPGNGWITNDASLQLSQRCSALRGRLARSRRA